MAEFINPMSYVEDNTVSDHEENKGMGIEDDKVNLDLFIDDEPVMDNKPSDYYGFTNKSQSQAYARAEKDAYSKSNMRVFSYENGDGRNYFPNLQNQISMILKMWNYILKRLENLS